MDLQKEKGPPCVSADPSEGSLLGGTDPFEIITHREAKQSPPLQAVLDDLTQDFEAERHALTVEASWRHAAVLLIRAADDLCIRDLIGAEANRRAARERFISGNNAFRRVQGGLT
jgi:hypothetical protein